MPEPQPEQQPRKAYTNEPIVAESLESQWFDRFMVCDPFNLGGSELYAGSAKHRKVVRQNFLDGEIENPTFEYDKLKVWPLDESIAGLLQLKREIKDGLKIHYPYERLDDYAEADVKEQAMRLLYLWRINTALAHTYMKKATLEGDVKRFERYSNFAYGKPNQEVFRYTLQNERVTAQAVIDDPTANEHAKASAELLLSLLPELDMSSSIELPSDELVEFSKDTVLSEFEGLIELNDNHKYTAEEMVEKYGEFFQALGIDFSVILRDEDDSKKAMTVNTIRDTLKIPRQRIHDGRVLRRKIIHEGWTHVFRAVEGRKTSIKLLGRVGFDRINRAEEGIASHREELVRPKMFTDFAGLDRNLSIGLARGADSTPRNFRQTYEVMKAHYLLKALKSNKDAEINMDQVEKDAEIRAYNHVERTFSGSPDTSVPGAVSTVDLRYREGEVAVWQLLADKPFMIKLFNLGRYDPGNHRHVWALRVLDVIDDADLDV